MALRAPERDRNDQDAAHNPSQQDYDAKFNQITSDFSSSPGTDDMQNIEDYANSSNTAKDLQKLENYANSPGDSDRYAGDPHSKTDDIVKAKDQEERGGWKDRFKGGKKQKFDFKAFMKKKGPAGLIGGMLLGGGGMMGFFGGPGLLIVQLKETMTEKFSDQVAAMDVRTTALLKKKFKGTTSGFCTSKLSIRCRYETMSKRQVKKLEKAGIKVNSSGETFLKGRIKIDTLEFDGVKTGAQDLEKRLRTEPKFRGAMLKGYNPKLAAYADSLFTKLTTKLGIKKDKNVTGEVTEGEASESLKKAAEEAAEEATDANSAAEAAEEAAKEAEEAAAQEGATELQKQEAIDARNTATEAKVYAKETSLKAMRAAQEVINASARGQVIDIASGDAAIEAKAGVKKTEEACDGGSDCEDGKRTVYKDANGKTISESDYNTAVENSNTLTDELEAKKALTETGGKATKATIKGALTSTALGLGAVDSACTGYMLIRTVGFAAKALGMMQLLRYAFVFMNTADSIKAGDATPEQINFVGGTLTAPNSQGKSATDSYGYKYAAYGDVGGMPSNDDIGAESMDENGNNISLSDEEKEKVLLNDEVTKYINGQLVSNNLLTDIIKLVDAASVTEADDICGFVKSGWGQSIIIGTAVVGAVVAFFSGGLSLTWGAAAQVAVSVGLSIAIAVLTPKLIEMASGTMINGYENGNQAGNAITSGMGGFNDQTAQARGIPALEQEDAVAYQELTEQTLAQYKEVDRTEYSPLDASNPNTFMGSLVSKVVPYTSKMTNFASGLSAVKQFTVSAFSGLLPNISASDPADQYKVCQDVDYKDLDLAVDPFCNVRHGLSKETLGIDPMTAHDYMIENNLADEYTGEPTEDDNEYAEYIKNCMDRSVSIGAYVSEDDTNKGEECIQGHHSGEEERKYNMFRLFYLDTSVDEGMENGYAQSARASTTTNGQVVSPVAPNHTLVGGYGPRGSVAGAPNATSWHAAIDINSSPTDVFAAMDGEVVFVEGSGANVVTIKHADGLKTNYLHMWPDDVTVKVGDKVTAGQKIGKIGCAGEAEGLCSGDHLDFNIWIDEVEDKSAYSKYKTAPSDAGNSAGKAINPANFLTDNGVTGYEDFVNDL